ncbi:capsular biosynthesis protein [Salinicola aestuarinus]|uniref:capsular biosynthesis protein n=1 Tax=Salinicola aestuarinus TaxID=1949082 RepID=UPI000DA1658A|nr:capsular biosynthesis protein [Salinicola aestuarinus]
MKRLIVDLDDTVSFTTKGDYVNSSPNQPLIRRLKDYKKVGFEIVINTSRNVRTYSGNLGKINANTLPVIIEWLDKHDVPYDEVYVGKPWCGHEGFHVDDKAVRPDEFINLSYEELRALTSKPNDPD